MRAFPTSLLTRYLSSTNHTKSIDNLITSAAHAAVKLSRARDERNRVTEACLVPSSSDPECLCNGVVKLQNDATSAVTVAGKRLYVALVNWAAKVAREKRSKVKSVAKKK